MPLRTSPNRARQGSEPAAKTAGPVAGLTNCRSSLQEDSHLPDRTDCVHQRAPERGSLAAKRPPGGPKGLGCAPWGPSSVRAQARGPGWRRRRCAGRREGRQPTFTKSSISGSLSSPFAVAESIMLPAPGASVPGRGGATSAAPGARALLPCCAAPFFKAAFNYFFL